MEYITLVNEVDEVIGKIEKLEAHKKAKLHRAFSIIIINDKEEMLIHQRADHKYHSGGLWTNSCCSHPRYGEPLEEAVHRRLQEELGFDCSMKEIFKFKYKKSFDNELTEFEYDHVFVGCYNKEKILLNKAEVKAFQWISLNDLLKDIKQSPEKYTYWFKLIMEKIEMKNINIFRVI